MTALRVATNSAKETMHRANAWFARVESSLLDLSHVLLLISCKSRASAQRDKPHGAVGESVMEVEVRMTSAWPQILSGVSNDGILAE